MKLSELAPRVGARLENCVEDADITGVAPIEEAEPGHIAFAGSNRELAAAKTTRASALIPCSAQAFRVPVLRGGHPYLIFARVLDLFFTPPRYEIGVHPTAVIHPSARIGPNASIGAYVVIERDVEIGADAVLLPHVVIYRAASIGRNFLAHAHAVVRENCRVGDNVTLQNGAIIGADAFCFAHDDNPDLGWKKVVQPGPAVLDDNVEVQANACVSRSDKGETRIGRDTRIGALAIVGHEVTIGDHSSVCPQAGVGGGAKIGRNVMLMGQSAVVDGCVIGDGTVITARGGVTNDVAAGQMLSGYPAIDHKSWLRSVAWFKRLPELARRLHPSTTGQG